MKEASPAKSPIPDDRRSVESAIEAAKRKVQERDYTAAIHDCEEAMVVLFDKPSSMAVQHSISEGLECSGDAYFGLKNYEAALSKYEEAFRVRSQVFQRLERPMMDLLFKLERTLVALYESYYLDNAVEPDKRSGTLNWTQAIESEPEEEHPPNESVVPGQKIEETHAVWKRVVKKKSGGGTSLLKRLSMPSLLIPIVLLFILSVTIPLTFSYIKGANDAAQQNQSTVAAADSATGAATGSGTGSGTGSATGTETGTTDAATTTATSNQAETPEPDNSDEQATQQDSTDQSKVAASVKDNRDNSSSDQKQTSTDDTVADDSSDTSADSSPPPIVKKPLSGRATASSSRPRGGRASSRHTTDSALQDGSATKASRAGRQSKVRASISPTSKWMQDASSGQIADKVFASADKSVLFTFKHLGDVQIRNGPTQITKHFYVDTFTQAASVFPEVLLKKCLWLSDAKIGFMDLNGDVFFDVSNPDFLTVQQMFKVAAMARDNLEALKKRPPDGVSIKAASGKSYESCLSSIKSDPAFKKLKPGSIVCILPPEEKKKKFLVVGIAKSGDLLPCGRFARSYLTNQEFDSSKVALAGIDVVILTSLDVQQARFKIVLIMSVLACACLLMSMFARTRAVKAFAVLAMIAAIILTILGLANALTAVGIQTIR